MMAIAPGKKLDLKVRRVLKTNLRGGVGRAQEIGQSADTPSNELPPSPSNGQTSIPNSQTGPGSGNASYTSRGGTRTKK